MKSKEFINEMDMDTRFDDMCSKRKAMFVGAFTNLLGEFHEKGLVIANPGFNCTVSVHSRDDNLLQKAHEVFGDELDVTPIKHIGQSLSGFKIHVGDLTLGSYIKHLTDLYHQLF